MAWLLMLGPIALILWFHFRNQKKNELLCRASNYWILFYVAGYFLPIPLFMAGEDGWSTIWGYSFSDLPGSLSQAVLLATLGGMVLSLAASPRRRKPVKKVLATAAGGASVPAVVPARDYSLKPVRVVAVAAGVLGCLYVGISLLGGLWTLLENLGDRINLFAGLNAFFVPLNMLIGVSFAVSAARLTEKKISPWAEAAALAVTLAGLLVLGQKSNIFILIVGIVIIKALPRRDIKLRWVVLGVVALANILMLYEFVFREAMIIGVDPERLTIAGWSNYLLTQVTGNLMQIQNLTVLVEAVPDLQPYSLGDTYIAFFSVIVPQTFMAVKPLTAAGVHTLAFWPEVVARESTTMPPGLFAEAYLNFGSVGYLALCAAVGLTLKMIDGPFQRGGEMSRMDVVMVAAAGAVSLHFIRGEFFSPVLILVGILIGSRVVFSRKAPGRRRRARKPASVHLPRMPIHD